jgi:hypothetical protein
VKTSSRRLKPDSCQTHQYKTGRLTPDSARPRHKCHYSPVCISTTSWPTNVELVPSGVSAFMCCCGILCEAIQIYRVSSDLKTEGYNFDSNSTISCLKSNNYYLYWIKVHYTPWRRLGERRYSSYSFLTSALHGGEWSASRPGRALSTGKDHQYPLEMRLGRRQSRSGHRG